MAKNIIKVLKKYSFPEFRAVDGRLSIADLHKPKERCGIYLLRFANDEYYIGQAVDVVRRFGQHRRTHSDIVALSFVQVECEDLNAVERNAIYSVERAGIPLRNINEMSEPKIDSDFDDLVSPAEKDAWLVSNQPSDLVGERVRDDGLRQRYGHRYKSFMKLPYADDCISVLRQYVRWCLPYPLRTEMTFWACSAKPSGLNTVFSARYTCMNVNWQEVSHIYEQDGQFIITFHLSLSPISHEYGSLAKFARRHRWVDIWRHQYRPGGPDQFAVILDGADNARRFLELPAAVAAIRLLNWRLMRKGPTTFSRYHCFALADRILACGAANEHQLSDDDDGFFSRFGGHLRNGVFDSLR